ncbi:hypothetical protein Sme01_53790 [Sphaerisporangium melleum]|uniref:Uncharacterized protein n=1 Tax=Sphaerisporangium melleum TaxID=321316 RepID=A0A917R5V4_9ACTN|nr:hypothetical protein [Sphaerisporangium melleum]GGK91438.1 hypothetical protein GCM10007964_37650 [Sphaerisporangium melleum]GII72903.1 hypothetical protein Sme01_53790 [Sphaerisporangium melleum]
MTLLLGLLSLTAACGGAEKDMTATSAEAGPAQPVAVWRAEGGFVTATTNALRPPRVVLYSDGLVIADASKQIKLTDAETRQTVASMEKYLAGRPPTAEPKPGAPMVTDLPDTVLGVRGKDGKLLEVRVPALDQLAAFYPKEIVDAKKLMDGLATRATEKGTDYVATRVRVVAEGAESAEGKPAPWPAGVPEPTGTLDPVWQQDLEGAAVSAITKAVPTGEQYGRSLFKTGSGKLFVLSWRYLLPDEQPKGEAQG